MTSILDDLLGESLADRFVSEIRGQTYLHVPGDPDKLSHLLAWENINTILDNSALQFPRVKAVRGRVATAASKQSANEHLKAPELTALLRDGGTLVIDAIDELHAPVGLLCRGLERALGVPVQANMYASWSTESAFDLHCDFHDVLVLQIIGRKRWAIYGQTVRFPLADDVPPPPPACPAQWEQNLLPGNILYLPRGWWHCVTPLAEPTVHLTLGFQGPTGIDIMRRLTRELRQSEVMRMEVPRCANVERQAEYLSKLQTIIVDACSQPGLVMGVLRDACAVIYPRRLFGLPWSAAPSLRLPEECLIVPMTRLTPVIDHLEDEMAIELCHSGRKFRFPAATEALFELVLSGERLTVGDFLERSQSRHPEEELRVFLSDLVRCDLIILRAPDSRLGPHVD